MDQVLADKTEQLEKEVSDERARLSSDRMDISFGELINLYRNKELIIRPEYQRLFRWSSIQKTALIESILVSIPIPPIFVAEDEDGVWELVDGLQRVATFISFFGELDADVSKLSYQLLDNEDGGDDSEDIDSTDDEKQVAIGNKWRLEAGGLIKNLEGFDIDTLPSKYKINLKRAVCRVEILRGQSNTAMKYELFKRLNSGGSKLTPQEIRNAIYRGINPKINELILELSQNEIFQKLTALSKQKKQELYEQELVLRIIAFLNRLDKINDNTENFLNSFMEEAVKDDEFNSEYYRVIFNDVINMINEINDEKVFRNSSNLFVPAYFEGILIGLAHNIDFYRNNIELLKSKILELKSDINFKRFSGSASNSKSRIRTRLNRANEIFASVSEEG
ncbi:DUF262 domain-containing protein [Desulfosporosinus meridiei]|uniref:GmrSD restriction endonucleases N-terminal domain-containing protein n=1 Tax=Desulfosporosinus meridiei (strain ATCC BAA-275 / DSM 13257 / KCTC 12902 / NCIMB 13706 / S10) TaxID=768704 RepID=J7INK3_DESMD|nr:DUF262 domain-containing protein [Desulfosporosinus meridiei]AFQ43392.1 Protein of unknown function DUF262 [Desulfosporosinus meridiei DSM 13257]